MDLDEEELKATRILNGAGSADEMFEKLEYKKMKKLTNYISYANIEDKDIIIRFDLINKTVEKYCFVPYESEPRDITMQELQAINKKCKELGWI